MKPSIAIFAEYSPQIGTGHLIESLYLYRVASDKGFEVSMWIPDTVPESILERFSYSYNFFRSFNSKDEPTRLRKKLIKEGKNLIVFNFQKINNKILSYFKDKNFRLICIDELGNRRLDCDIVINPSIVEKHCKYPSNNTQPFFTGPRYLSMSPEFAKDHLKKRTFGPKIKTVSISMGGVDRTGTTLKLIDSLAKWRPKVKKNIILGDGFLYLEDVYKKIENLKGNNFRIYRNVSNVESLFLESDIAFTAGGDTLYELACVGTPAIILYEDEHEREDGLAFGSYGFGDCVGRGVDVSKEDILNTIEKFEDIKLRQAHSFRGKEIVDGRGSYRILDIIESECCR